MNIESDEIGTEIAALLDTALDPIWTPQWRLLASVLDQIGVDFGPPGVVGEISRN